MSQTLSISTSHSHDVCDVCARTLLRGERTEVFVSGGRRYSVCELCKPHALHEGWIREGALPQAPAREERPARRRSLFARRRAPAAREIELDQAPATLDDELGAGLAVRAGAAAARVPQPRHVHALPTSAEHRVAVALDVFNASAHRRTVASVARSLGAPAVNVTPDPAHPAVVWIVVCWELCWYRYEVDLSDAQGHTRLDAQGYELSELEPHERLANALADDSGALSLH